jgi:hypothetical protein
MRVQREWRVQVVERRIEQCRIRNRRKEKEDSHRSHSIQPETL